MCTKNQNACRDWTPVSSGRLYCSPACGRGCTRTEWNNAVERSEELAILLGNSWKPSVWENLGWHYRAISENGLIKVHPSITRGKIDYYMAFLGKMDAGGRWSNVGCTPQEAVDNVCALAIHEIRELCKHAGLSATIQ